MKFISYKCLLYLILAVSCEITILSPEILVSEVTQLYGEPKINFTITNLGIFPYGRSLDGRIYYPTYSFERTGCTYSSIKSVQFFSNRNNTILNTPLLVLKGDECDLYTKERSAELLAANLLIVIEPIINQSHTSKRDIPTTTISEKDGSLLLKYLENSNVTISVNFDIVPKQKKLSITLWIDVGEFYEGENLQNISKVLKHFDGYADFTVYYLYQSNLTNSFDCVSNRQYCIDRNYFSDEMYYGKDFMMETIRQMCIFQLSPAKTFFSYLGKFVRKSPNKKNIKNPLVYRNEIYEILGLSTEQIEHCVAYSFMGADYPGTSDNTMLQNQKEQSETFNTFNVMINGLLLQGRINENNIKSALCSGFLQGYQPEICTQELINQDANDKGPEKNNKDNENNNDQEPGKNQSNKETEKNSKEPEKNQSDNETEKNSNGEKPEKNQSDNETEKNRNEPEKNTNASFQCVCDCTERSKISEFFIILISIVIGTVLSGGIFLGIQYFRKKKALTAEPMNRHLPLAEVSS